MDNIDVEEHFRTRWTGKGIRDSKEFLILIIVTRVSIGVIYRPAKSWFSYSLFIDPLKLLNEPLPKLCAP